jgi:hypothetical protein
MATDRTGPTKSFSRRALLRGGLGGAALLLLSGGALALQRSKLRAVPSVGLKVLSEGEYAVLAAIAERMCPSAGPGIPGAAEIDVALMTDRMLEYAEQDVVEGLKLGLGLIESGLVGALFGERVKPFTQLAPADQDRVLIAFRESELPVRRTIFRSFAGLTGSIYYGDPRSWPSVGYPGPPSPSGLREAYAGQLVELEALTKKG